MVHGDLSAYNVLLSSGGAEAKGRGWTAKVADFGLSRSLGATQDVHQTQNYGGCPLR